jgi:hypothetical protein
MSETTTHPSIGGKLALSKVRRGLKAQTRGGATGKLPKVRQVVNSRAALVGQGVAFKAKLPHLAGKGGDQAEL